MSASSGSHRFIALEGADGAGKSSIRSWLHGALCRSGCEPLVLGQHCWLSLVHTEIITMARMHGQATEPQRITDAYVGDRLAASRQLIQPHLARRCVIADRFVVTDVVYHEVIWGRPPSETYGRYRTSGVRLPDVTLYVDAPLSTCRSRLVQRAPDLRRPWDAPESQRLVHRRYREVLFGRRFPGLSREVVRIDNSTTFESTITQLARWMRIWDRHDRAPSAGPAVELTP